MKIFLVGLPGSGKTTLGKLVAHELNMTFVDLDHNISKSEGTSIASIFHKAGEKNFRKIESEHLKSWCEKPEDFLMATGGGVPCFFSNMELINKSGFSIFLDTPVKEIARRMKNTELGKRPLFADQTIDTIEARVKEMRDKRISFYSQAQLVYREDQIVVGNIVKDLRSLEGKSNSENDIGIF